jgi:hypothetical protein
MDVSSNHSYGAEKRWMINKSKRIF